MLPLPWTWFMSRFSINLLSAIVVWRLKNHTEKKPQLLICYWFKWIGVKMECGLIVNVTQGIMCDFSNVCIYFDCITAMMIINFCLLICFWCNFCFRCGSRRIEKYYVWFLGEYCIKTSFSYWKALIPIKRKPFKGKPKARLAN